MRTMDSSPLTIVHLITELNVGGAEQMLRKVIARMDRKKWRCVVVSMTDQGPIGERIEAEGIPVFSLGMTLGRPHPRGIWRLFHILRRERADILQSWLYHADLMAVLVGKIAAVRKIVWGIRCSDMDLKNYRLLTALTVHLCARLSPLADAIVVNSQEGKRVHREMGYHSSRMILIPNGFDTLRFRPDPEAGDSLRRELGLGRETVLIGLVARFDPMKDHGTFLRAASLLASGEERVHFVLAGSEILPSNPLLSSRLDSSLEGRVHLLGPREDMPRLTAALDIATNSSAYGEGFSNTIGEAMACGVPCVATHVGDAARLIGDSGIVVPPRDPDALAGAWHRMLDMGRGGRSLLGARARRRVVAEFSIEKVVGRFEDFYQGICSGPSEGATKEARTT